MTAGALIRALAALGPGASVAYPVDYSTKIEGQFQVVCAFGGAISATRGLRITMHGMYGSGGDSSIPNYAFDIPGIGAGSWESKLFYLGTGYWNIKFLNLDLANSISFELTNQTVSEMVP